MNSLPSSPEKLAHALGSEESCTSAISQDLSLLHRAGNRTAFPNQAVGNETCISLQDYTVILHDLQAVLVSLKAVKNQV